MTKVLTGCLGYCKYADHTVGGQFLCTHKEHGQLRARNNVTAYETNCPCFEFNRALFLEHLVQSETFPMGPIRFMHQKFGINYDGGPRMLDDEEAAFRIVAMREEIDEYELACHDGNLVEAYDALLDLMVFALGTFERMGLPFSVGFGIVQAANCAKRLADNANESKRGFKADLVKPEGWESPNAALSALLNTILRIVDEITEANALKVAAQQACEAAGVLNPEVIAPHDSNPSS
jgi:predicted HAD superfamily Cof-like phosphohydrolase